MAHRIACDRCTDEPALGPGKEEHSNILLFHYLAVVVRAGFGRWVSINNFFTGKSQMVRRGHVLPVAATLTILPELCSLLGLVEGGRCRCRCRWSRLTLS